MARRPLDWNRTGSQIDPKGFDRCLFIVVVARLILDPLKTRRTAISRDESGSTKRNTSGASWMEAASL